MSTAAQLAMTRRNEARREALFASGLQPSDALTAGMVAEAITCSVRQFGTGGCAGRMAQEFGDHPDAAARRMRWVRQLVQAAARPQAGPGAEPPGRSPGRGLAPAGAGDRAGAAAGAGYRAGAAAGAGYRAGAAAGAGDRAGAVGGPGTRLDGHDAAKGPVAA